MPDWMLSKLKQLKTNHKALYALIGGLIVLSLISPVSTQSESIRIYATVPSKPSDFQLVLNGPPSQDLITPNTTIQYQLNYGSYLSTATDVVVLEVSWSQGQIDDGSGNLVNILQYVSGSASSALGGATPNVNISARKITWQINPMLQGLNRTVSWQLKTLASYSGPSQVNFQISSRLIGPGGVVKTAPSIQNTYIYTLPTATPYPTPEATPNVQPTPTAEPSPPDATPTPEPTSVQPTPTIAPTVQPSPTPIKKPQNILAPIIDVVKDVPIIGAPIKEVVDEVIEVAQGGGSVVAAPVAVAVVSIPAIATVWSMLAYMPWWQLPSLFSALFWSKRRRPWGVVYDAKTKEPLDPVLLILTDQSGKSYQAISDIYGRYQFLVEPGIYKLEAKKSNYVFPATSLNSAPTDGLYHDLYFGEEITIEDADTINYNVPMDAESEDWNQQSKARLGLVRSLHVPVWLEVGLFWGGYAWTIIMALLAVTLVNVIVLIFYTLLVTLRLVHLLRSPWGTVYGPNNKPVPSAAVHLVDVNNPLLKRPPVVTKKSGRYSFLVEKGKYQLKVALKQSFGYGAPVDGPIVSVTSKTGTINEDLEVSLNTNQESEVDSSSK